MKLGKNKKQLHKGSKIKKITIKRMMIKIKINQRATTIFFIGG